jgi:hypothetical protein
MVKENKGLAAKVHIRHKTWKYFCALWAFSRQKNSSTCRTFLHDLCGLRELLLKQLSLSLLREIQGPTSKTVLLNRRSLRSRRKSIQVPRPKNGSHFDRTPARSSTCCSLEAAGSETENYAKEE